MYKIFTLLVVTSIYFAQAAIIYTEDFTDVATLSSSSSESLGDSLSSGQFHLPVNGATISSQLDVTSNDGGARFRAAGVWVDTSTVAAGDLFTVTFDVTSFTASSLTTALSSLQIYGVNNISGIGSGTGTAGFDLQHGSDVDSLDLRLTDGATGGLLDSLSITSTGTDITLSFLNSGYDAIGLFFVNSSLDADAFGGAGLNNDFSIDNLSLSTSTVPEPSSMALLALGLTSLAFTRRRKA